MNRGFGFYFGHAIKSSAKTLWRKGNLLKYFAWVIMELLSPFTLILGAMFSLANVRQAKIAERENTVDIPQSFKVAGRAQPFWTMILAIVLEALIFIAGVILIGIAGVLLNVISNAVSVFVDTVPQGIIKLIFIAPCPIVLLIYTIIMVMIFAPTAYVIETNPDIGAANAISICFNTMKSRGKGTLFLNYFIPALMECAVILFGLALEVVVLWLTGYPFAELASFEVGLELAIIWTSESSLAFILTLLVGLLTFIAFALIVPMFTLARKISNKSLFEDIALDPVNASKRTNGVNIRKCKGVKFDPARYENELSALFDETYTDRVPVPENPSAARRRQLKERKAAMAASVAEKPAYNPVPAPAPVPEPAPILVPAPELVNTAANDEDDGELLTVSELIRDVEVETPAPVVAEEPVVEKLVAEEPVAVEPEKTEEPVAEEPVAVEPEKTEEPVTEEPVAVEPEKTEEPVTEETVTAEPEKTEEPVAEETVTAEPEKTEEPVTEETVTAEPEKTEELVVEETVTAEPEKTEEPVTEEPAEETEPVKKAKKSTSAKTKKTAKKSTDGEETK